jgi:PKD repeat protein
MAAFASPAPHRPNRSAFWQDSFYYLDVSSLPVKADSAAITGAMYAYHTGQGLSTEIGFRPFGLSNWNAGNSAGYFADTLPSNLDPATARRTWIANTTQAQQAGTHLYFSDLRQQGATRNVLGQYSIVGFGDRHGIIWSESSDELMECIGYSGFSAACMHNVTYDLSSYDMPFASNGTTPAGAIAPRFPVAPLFFTYQDLVDCGSSGNLGHMVGFVLQDYRNQRQWPSRGGDGKQTTGPKSGEVIRLRSDFNMASLPNDMMRALARTLQTHGAILFDLGDYPTIITCNDPLWNTTTRASFPFDQFQCVDISSVAGPEHSIRLASTSAGNLVPVPSFTHSPPAGAAPLTVNFDASASTDPDGTISSYAWNFGDGTIGTGETTAHTYTSTGSFTPTLTVTDNDGASASVAASGWTPKYPLDVPEGYVRYGVSYPGDVATKYEDPIGKSLAIYRRFFSWAGRGSMDAELIENAAAGRATWLSFKTPLWADMAAGLYQAEVDAMLVELRNTGINCWLTPFHEPEDNVSESGSPANWRAMVRHVEARRKVVGATNVLIVPILMAYTFLPASGRTVSDWMLPESDFPLYSIDYYNNEYETSPPGFDTNIWNNAMAALTTTYGKDIAIGEMGGVVGDSSFVRVPELWEAMVAESMNRGFKAALWFDGPNDGGYNELDGSNDPGGAVYQAVLDTLDSPTCYRLGITGTGVTAGSIDVTGTPAPANVAPNAVATVVAASGVAPFTASFSSSGSSDSDGTIASYLWSFGDGTTSTSANPTHTYTTAGTYSVSLRVTDNDGATDTSPLGSVITVAAPVIVTPPVTGGGSCPTPEYVRTAGFKAAVANGNPETYSLSGMTVGNRLVMVYSQARWGGTYPIVADVPLTSLNNAASRSTLGFSYEPYVLAGTSSGAPSRGVFRFPGVAIPEGATITAAWVRLASADSQNDVNALVSFEATPNGAGFGTGERDTAGEIDSIVTTSASVLWNEAGLTTGGDSTPDLTAPLNEVLGNGFENGDALVVVMDGQTSPANRLTVIEGTATPILFIEFDTPTPPESGVGYATPPGWELVEESYNALLDGTYYWSSTVMFTKVADATSETVTLYHSGQGGSTGWGAVYEFTPSSVAASTTHIGIPADPSDPANIDVGDGKCAVLWTLTTGGPVGTSPPDMTYTPSNGFTNLSADGGSLRKHAAAYIEDVSGVVPLPQVTDPQSFPSPARYPYAAIAVALSEGVTPVAVAGSDVTGDAPLSVTFDQTGTSTTGVSYLWAFGDGTTSTSANPSHTYAVPGTYVATLTVTGVPSGCESVDAVTVTVTEPDPGPDPDPCSPVPADLADPVTFTVGSGVVTIESLDGPGGIYGEPGSGLIADGTDHADPAIHVAASYGALDADTSIHFSVTASLVSPGCTVADDPVVTLVGVIDGVGTALASGSAVDTGGGVWHLSLDHVLAAAWPDVYVIAAVPTGCV